MKLPYRLSMFVAIVVLSLGYSIHSTILPNTTSKKERKKNIAFLKEKIVIDHGLELYRNLQNHESDCFKKATIRLSEGCNSLNKLDGIASMKYAIALTLCELSTAHIPIPVECEALHRSSDIESSNDVITNCAHTLSKMPQTWTSYSGYHRDVVMMCFAIRYPMEKEILEKLHANITLNQAKNFELLKNQHEYLVRWHKQEMNTFDHLKASQYELWQQMQSVQQIHAQTANQIQMIFDTLVLVRNSTELVVSKYSNMVHYHMQELQSQLNQLAIRQAMEIDQLVHSVLDDLTQVESGLSKMIRAQRKVIEDWDETKMIQKEYLNIWQESIEQVNTRLNEVMNHSLQHLRSIKQDISIVQDQISWLILPFKWLRNTLTNFYINIRTGISKLLIHALLFNYVFKEITGGYIKKLGSAFAAATFHFYLYRFLREKYTNELTESSFDCFLIVAEFVGANRLPLKLVRFVYRLLYDTETHMVGTPDLSISHDDNHSSISPAEVSQNENNDVAHTNNFNHYHFHNYYLKEPNANQQVATELNEEDCDGILPLKVGEYTR